MEFMDSIFINYIEDLKVNGQENIYQGCFDQKICSVFELMLGKKQVLGESCVNGGFCILINNLFFRKI